MRMRQRSKEDQIHTSILRERGAGQLSFHSASCEGDITGMPLLVGSLFLEDVEVPRVALKYSALRDLIY